MRFSHISCTLRRALTLLACLAAALTSASADPVSAPSLASGSQPARSAWLLNWQREVEAGGGVDPLSFGQSRRSGQAAGRDALSGVLPVSLQIGTGTSIRFARAFAGPDQASRDPVRVNVQGFGFTADYGGVQSDSQVYFARPELDGGAAATLAYGIRRAGAPGAVAASRLQEGRAVRQTLAIERGSTKITGLFSEVDRSFALPQRLLGSGGGGDTTRLLQELSKQSGTRRTSLGITTGLGNGWALTGGVDALGDGAGRLRRQELGISGGILKVSALRQDVAAGFSGFDRFGDPEVKKLAAQKGVRRNMLQWALTPTAGLGFQGSLDTSRDAAGSVDMRSLAFHFGSLQATESRRTVSGFTTFGALAEPGQALKKLGNVALRERSVALGLGGKSRLAFTSVGATDAGGSYQDDTYALEGRTFTARARFRSVAAGFTGATGLATLDKKYAALNALRGQREEGYDLDYIGSSWLGLRNHYGQVRGQDAGGDAWTRRTWSNAADLKLGRTLAQVSRLQTDTERAAGEAQHRVEHYLLRRAVQKDGFLLAEHTQQTDSDAEGNSKVLQTSRLQSKLRVWSLFNMDGQRIERRGTEIGHEHQSDLNLSRQFGSLGIAWKYHDRDDAKGTEVVRKLSLRGELLRGLQLAASRETRVTRSSPDGGVTLNRGEHGSDTRCTVTQSFGKASKLSFSYARVTAADAMRSREYSGRLETPVGRLRLTTDFTQRQAAGQPTAVVQGFALADEGKDRRLTWSCLYRHRSGMAGTEMETKGWTLGYNGVGTIPLKIAASLLRNAEDAKGNVTPGTQSRVAVTTGVNRRLTLGASYGNSVDGRARKADEKFELSLSGPLGENRKLTALLSTQRLFEPEGAGSKRTRVEKARLEYSRTVSETQMLTLGADVSWRASRGAASSYGCEYRSDVKWEKRW